MSDLDARLAALFVRQAPAADFDARLAVRLEAERHRESRLDRAAALELALREHALQRSVQARRQSRAVIPILVLGVAALLAVLLTVGFWQDAGGQLALQMRAAAAYTPADTPWLVLPAALIVLASVRPQWLRSLWDSALG
jgi:hypothetical protein